MQKKITLVNFDILKSGEEEKISVFLQILFSLYLGARALVLVQMKMVFYSFCIKRHPFSNVAQKYVFSKAYVDFYLT